MSNLVIKIANLPEDFSAIKAIRKEVFQQEQKVDSALDFDGKDEICEQLLAYLNGQAVGTVRIRYLDAKIAKIERLAVLSLARGQGIGKKIMEKSLEIIAIKNIPEVVINAQEYIKKMYEDLGFQEVGEKFEEAGIFHIKMIKHLEIQ
jgi:predicted GNAT family N-acyltransferase